MTGLSLPASSTTGTEQNSLRILNLTESEQIQEWVNYYNASLMKFNALKAVLQNGGEAMLTKVLKKLGYSSAADVIKNCPDEPFRHFQK